MAGGDRQGNHGTMADRVARTEARGHGTVNRPPPRTGTGPDPRSYGETATYRDPAHPGQHVWVATEHGTNPGLLIEWRKPDQLPWEGRVVHMRQVDARWAKVEEWLPAGAISQT